ncbi:ABC transporter permease [Saccharophagus sp. K07]|jgi:ABC-2 type transport system permease protein|uniref:ABC transporter permease n=1 Tax=Saccharophagus sp. K07 TaxID=2283636 RepID=UPI001652A60B|nr:ABC transporter permease [Saccharophagus sp. K07]MBC6905313.1 ABC transporter permease [Saccharophagus sp. K07]
MNSPIQNQPINGILSQHTKPKPLNTFSAAMALGWRALLKIKHVPFQLFDVTVFPLMMTLMFTYLFGGALAGSPQEYIQYLLPGILVQTILFITVYTGVGLNTDISKGIYDRFRSMPIWPSAPVFGALLGDVLRYSIAAIMVLGLGFILGFRPQGGLLGVILAVVLVQIFASSLAWIWIIVGMLVKSPESVMTTSFLFLFPLTFASNVFVDPATMPGWLQAFVSVNPVTQLANASRGLMHGAPDISSIVWVLIATAIITAIFAPIALRMYHRER